MAAHFDRREFLRRGAAAGVGLGLLPLGAAATADEAPRVRRSVRLGRTGLEIPDIGFGGSSLSSDTALVRHALDRGITYFDTAEGYRGGASEETLGRALEGERERVVLASKVQTNASASRAEFMNALEGSLRRLRTDRIDIYFNHAVNDVRRLSNPEWGEFVQRAKQQGKIRFTGMSGHSGRLAECVDYALDHDLADVLLLAHNFGQDPGFLAKLTKGFDFVALQPELPRVLAKARAKDVGVIAMKTLRGARLNDMRPFETGGATFAQAAFRWVLSLPNVDALVVTMTSPDEIDEYLGASGWQRARAGDARMLAAYEARNRTTQCHYGCTACLESCPSAVPISEIIRAGMYERDYGDPELARSEYAALEHDASACLSCAARPCASACPFGVEIERLVTGTHERLTTQGRRSES